MRQAQGRGGFVGPFILVGIGILFLLNNLGLMQVNVWRLVGTLWPVALIGVGLDLLIGRRSTAGALLVLLITGIFLVGGVFLTGMRPGSAAQSIVQEIRYAPGAVSEADIRISTSTGRLTVGALRNSDALVEGTLRLAGNEEVKEETSEENGKAVYRLSSEGVGVSGSESRWELHINGEAPANLHISTGAGETELHLERLRLTGLNVDLGIGATTITLPRSGAFVGEISGGIGKLVVRVPDSLAARLHVDTGIGQVQVARTFRTAGENVYLSPAAQEGVESVTLRISSGIGQVVVEGVAAE